MKDMNEYKAEVFFRSEKRIKERRKKRNRILTICIPLCMVIIMGSVMLLPTMRMAKKANGSYAGFDGNSTNGSYVCSYTEAVIRNGTNTDSRIISDKVEVTEIFTAIFNLYGVADKAEQESDYYEYAVEDFPEYSGTTLNGYVITLRTEEGSETVYVLDGNKLLNVDEDMKIILTDSQLAELKEVLGILE